MPRPLRQPIDPKTESYRIEDIEGRGLAVPVELLFLAFRSDHEGTLAKLVLTIYREAAWDEIRWKLHDGYRVRLFTGEAFVSYRSWERRFGGKRERWRQLVQEIAGRLGWTVTTCRAGDERVERDAPGHMPGPYPSSDKGHTPAGSKRPLGTIVRIPYYSRFSSIVPADRQGLLAEYVGHTPGAEPGRRSAPPLTPSPPTPSLQTHMGRGEERPWKERKPERNPAAVNALANEMHSAIEEDDFQRANEVRDTMRSDRETAEERAKKKAQLREMRRLGQKHRRAREQGDSAEAERIGLSIERLFAAQNSASDLDER